MIKITNFSQKSIVVLGTIVALSFGSCVPDDNDCSNSMPIRITDNSYFSTDRVLTNNNNCEEGIDYIIEGTTAYSVSADLVIEPGVRIRFEGMTGLEIEETGSIAANGVAGSEIIMEGESAGLVGAWRGVMIYSDDIKNKLNYVTIDGAGGNSFNSNDDKGNLVVYADARVHITNCTFSNGAEYGLNSNYPSGNITNLSNCKFDNNKTPILIRANDADIVDASNTFSGNTNSYVHVRVRDIGSNETKRWQALAIPYRITTADFGISKQVSIGSNSSLTIEPGTTIEFEAQTGIKVDDTGAFIARGTSTNPIIFTGVTKIAGSWAGIAFEFTDNVLNEISHATIEYGGSTTQEGAIYMWADPKVRVMNVTFKDIEACAFFDSPKSQNQPDNPNLTRSDITYTNIGGGNYCRG